MRRGIAGGLGRWLVGIVLLLVGVLVPASSGGASASGPVVLPASFSQAQLAAIVDAEVAADPPPSGGSSQDLLSLGLGSSAAGLGGLSVAQQEQVNQSRTAYANLSGSQAFAALQHTEGSLLSSPEDLPPSLPSGTQITSYLSDYAARIVTGDGKHAAVVGLLPLAAKDASGVRAPVDLSLIP